MRQRLFLLLAVPPVLAGFAGAQEAPPAKKILPGVLNSRKIEVPPRTVLPFKEFKRSEFGRFDKNGNKTPIKPGETITLHNGRKVKIEDYIAATNKLEKQLNSMGYSLRKTETLPLPQSQLDEQNAARKQLDDSTKQAMSEPPKVLLDGVPYADAIAQLPAMPQASGGSANRLKASSPPLMETTAAHKMTVSGGKNFNWQADVAGFGFYMKGGLNVSGECDVTDGHYSQSLSEFSAGINADAGVELFGQDIDLLHSDATYSGSDKTGKVTLNAHLGVLGNTVWQDGVTETIGYSDGKTWSQSFDESIPSVSIPCSFFSVGVSAGVQGSAGIKVGYKLYTSRLDGYVQPFVNSSAYFQAGAGIDAWIASVDVGIRGTLTLLDDTLTVSANAGIYYDHGLRFKDELDISNSVNALSGNVSLYADASFLFFSAGVTIPIFSWSGYNNTTHFYHATQDLPLSWH